VAKDPAFLFYASDFLTGVTDLTFEERGQYITLLCLQHQKGSLNEKTIRLSVGNVSVDVLSKFSQDENGNYYNERLNIEIEKRAAFVDSRRENGLKGGRPKKPNGYPSAKPNGKAKKNLPINVNENEIIDYFVSNGYAKDLAQKFYLHYQPDWVDTNGKKVKDWKKKAQVVWFKEENKQQKRYDPSNPNQMHY
jgi:hypothetical protein